VKEPFHEEDVDAGGRLCGSGIVCVQHAEQPHRNAATLCAGSYASPSVVYDHHWNGD
jgi:hypothetical protein